MRIQKHLAELDVDVNVEAAPGSRRGEVRRLGVIAADGSLKQFIHAGMDPETATAISYLTKGPDGSAH